jgi:hypothetical protein
VADPEVDPPIIGGDVVDAIRCHLAEFRDDEVMHPDRLGLPLGAQFAATILEVADQFFFLGVNGDRRLMSGQSLSHTLVDVVKLRVPIGIGAAFPGLAVALQAELLLLQ